MLSASEIADDLTTIEKHCIHILARDVQGDRKMVDCVPRLASIEFDLVKSSREITAGVSWIELSERGKAVHAELTRRGEG